MRMSSLRVSARELESGVNRKWNRERGRVILRDLKLADQLHDVGESQLKPNEA